MPVKGKGTKSVKISLWILIVLYGVTFTLPGVVELSSVSFSEPIFGAVTATSSIVVIFSAVYLILNPNKHPLLFALLIMIFSILSACCAAGIKPFRYGGFFSAIVLIILGMIGIGTGILIIHYEKDLKNL